EDLRRKWFLQEGNSLRMSTVLRDHIVRVARHVQYPQIGIAPGEPLGKVTSAGTRHHNVRQEQVDFRSVISGQALRLLGCMRFDYLVAALGENHLRQLAYGGLVF